MRLFGVSHATNDLLNRYFVLLLLGSSIVRCRRPPIVTSRNKKCSGAAARALTGRRIMSDFLLQLLSIVRAPWAFTAAGRVRLLEKVTLAAPDAFAACGVRD